MKILHVVCQLAPIQSDLINLFTAEPVSSLPSQAVAEFGLTQISVLDNPPDESLKRCCKCVSECMCNVFDCNRSSCSKNGLILPVNLTFSPLCDDRCLLCCQKTSQELLHGFVECLECDYPEETDNMASDTVNSEGKVSALIRSAVHLTRGEKLRWTIDWEA